MPLQAPNLDDRQYSDIVAEAETLIPRYAPEWTNYNESDPGTTLVELFAWLSEIMIYRLNQVPDLNYIKFLQLLGIELQAAQPARAELTFTPARLDLVSTIIPIRTQISASLSPPPAAGIAGRRTRARLDPTVGSPWKPVRKSARAAVVSAREFFRPS